MAYSDNAFFKHQAEWNLGGGRESTENRGFVKPWAGPWRQRGELPLQVEGEGASQGGLCAP